MQPANPTLGLFFQLTLSYSMKYLAQQTYIIRRDTWLGGNSTIVFAVKSL